MVGLGKEWQGAPPRPERGLDRNGRRVRAAPSAPSEHLLDRGRPLRPDLLILVHGIEITGAECARRAAPRWLRPLWGFGRAPDARGCVEARRTHLGLTAWGREAP